jgi:hypothetical protein
MQAGQTEGSTADQARAPGREVAVTGEVLPGSRRITSAEQVLALVRDVMTEDNRYFILLAKHLQISQKHLSQIMVGNAKLSAQRMFDILDYLDLQVWVERR